MQEKLILPAGAKGAIWYHRPRRSAEWPKHRHRETELNIVVAGRASYALGDRRYELGADDLVWLFPAQEHQLIDRSEDFEMWVAVFSPELLRGAVHDNPAGVLAERSPEGRFCKSLEHTNATALGRLCAELQGASSSPYVFNAGLRYLVLRSWEKFAEASDEPTYHALHPAVENALSFLRRGESEESLVELSRHSRLSPARLSRAFKEQVGLGIAEYRNRMRLERFLETYGRRRRITALAAALEAGFNSYAQFYRVFCRLMGFSPSEYRRRAALRR